MPPQVTIVIPTLLSKPDLLASCLTSLNQQTFTDFEVILVVNRNKSRAQSMLPNIETTFKLNVVFMESNTGFATAMNAGIKKAKSEYIVALNDDTTQDIKWLEQLVEVQQESGAAMVASHIYLADKTTLDSQGFSFAWRGKAEAITKDAISFYKEADYWLATHNKDLLPTKSNDPDYWQEPFGPDAAACLYTRQLLNEVGAFEESFFAYLEDVDLALRARMAGYRCALAKEAVVWHHKHATSQGMGGFKRRQDMKNWWRIVTRYPLPVWRRFGGRILVERLRNMWGCVKR